MRYWLVKSEPDAFSWSQQVANGVEPWTGVRNHTAKLNLDTSFLCCDSSGYSRTRLTATAVLLHTPAARGVRYPCRNHEQETALVLISARTPPALTVTRELHILNDAEGRELVLVTLGREFGLKYAGTLP